MADYWRQRHHQKHWTKPVDVTLLYQLGTIAAHMKKRAEEEKDKQLEQWASQIRLIVARANGEELNISLAEHRIAAPDAIPKS